MKRVVVDASVVLAGLFKNGTVRDALLNPEDVAFLAPAYLKEEVSRHLSQIATRAKIPVITVEAVLDDLLAAIELMPPAVYSGSIQAGRDLARKVGAIRDADYIALALALGAPIWTLDKDFSGIPGLRVLSTGDLDRG